MFRVMNSQYDLDAAYLSCVGDHAARLEPFGAGVPEKVSASVHGAMVAARAVAEALRSGAHFADAFKTVRRGWGRGGKGREGC